MCEIKKVVSGDLTLITIFGDIDFQTLMEVMQEFYTENPTKNAIWDLSSASAEQIGSTEIEYIANFVSGYAQTRIGGRTALVAQEDLEFGVCRMIDTIAEIRGIPFEVASFRNLSAAIKWIGTDELPVVD